jgi:hypothetical protein
MFENDPPDEVTKRLGEIFTDALATDYSGNTHLRWGFLEQELGGMMEDTMERLRVGIRAAVGSAMGRIPGLSADKRFETWVDAVTDAALAGSTYRGDGDVSGL